MALDPRTDFQDDGGTPMFGARQQYTVIDAPARGFWATLRRMTFGQWISLMIVGAMIPFIVLFGGLALLAIFDAIRH